MRWGCRRMVSSKQHTMPCSDGGFCDNEDDSNDSTQCVWWQWQQTHWNHTNARQSYSYTTDNIHHRSLSFTQSVSVCLCVDEDEDERIGSDGTMLAATNAMERICFHCNSLHIFFAEFNFVFLPCRIRLHPFAFAQKCRRLRCAVLATPHVGNLKRLHTWICWGIRFRFMKRTRNP